MEHKYNRRKYFINKGYQGRLIGLTLLLAGGGCIIFALMFGTMYTDSLQRLYPDQGIGERLPYLPLLKQILIANWKFFGLLSLCVVFFTTLLSHRIVGPLYRFERTFDHMLQGYLDYTITLRDKDEGKELAEKINEFNEQLSDTLRTIQSSTLAVESLLEKVNQLELDEGQRQELSSLCWSLDAHNKKICRACNSYRLQEKTMAN